MSHKFTAGDTLFFVPSRVGSKRIVTIAKAGRKWMTLAGFFEGQRIAIDDPVLDVGIPRYGSVGRCYLDEQQYIDERALSIAWEKFRRDVSDKWAVPDGATVEWIAEARNFLGLNGAAK